jgi:ABC-type transporter lipoprotein component MlaA
MTRGLAEMSRLTKALGGDPLTCMGLAGMGDLAATCTSRHSRNRTFGEAFAAGESLAEYERRTGMVVEGAEAAASILPLAEARGVFDAAKQLGTPDKSGLTSALTEAAEVVESVEVQANGDTLPYDQDWVTQEAKDAYEAAIAAAQQVAELDSSTVAQIAEALDSLDARALKRRYADIVADMPKCALSSVLRATIAYRLQERHYG